MFALNLVLTYKTKWMRYIIFQDCSEPQGHLNSTTLTQTLHSSSIFPLLAQVCDLNDLPGAPSKQKEFCSKHILPSGENVRAWKCQRVRWARCDRFFCLVWSIKQYDGEKVDIKTVMETWTLQKGFPLVNIDLRSRKLILSQQRYLMTEPEYATTKAPVET